MVIIVIGSSILMGGMFVAVKKERKHYMIASWHPHRGSTKENPAYASGSGCYDIYFPLVNVNLDWCYTSVKQAWRKVNKWFNPPYTYCWVIEIHKEYTDEDGVDHYSWEYAEEM